MSSKKQCRIGIFIDGSYLARVQRYYLNDHPRRSGLSIVGLMRFICKEISAMWGIVCRIVEVHFFRGCLMISGNEEALAAERCLEDALTRAGVELHYLPIRGAKNELKEEKGIDVALALRAYKRAIAKSFDVIVLIAGDGDILPLVWEFKSMNPSIDVVLVSWDLQCQNGDVIGTSQDLLDAVTYPIRMSAVIDAPQNQGNPYIEGLFESEARQIAVAPPPQPPLSGVAVLQGPPIDAPTGAGFSPQSFPPSQPPYGGNRKWLTIAEMAEEWTGRVISLDRYGGWIGNQVYNNFHFFYSDIVGKKPEEMAPGMPLQFHLAFDRIKTEQKDNGEPSYRAIGPIYVMEPSFAMAV